MLSLAFGTVGDIYVLFNSHILPARYKQLCTTALIKKNSVPQPSCDVLPLIRKGVFDNYFILPATGWLEIPEEKPERPGQANRHDYFYGQFHLLLMAHMGVSPPGSSLPVSHSCLHDRLPPCPCICLGFHPLNVVKKNPLSCTDCTSREDGFPRTNRIWKAYTGVTHPANDLGWNGFNRLGFDINYIWVNSNVLYYLMGWGGVDSM